jgi:glycerol-3-phosphate dehydrogenase
MLPNGWGNKVSNRDDSFDLAVIGGGINGAGIAFDASGRGARVLLLEKGDLASGTSGASTKLIHGGLRYLEHYEFSLVREALQEREVLWRMAPHAIRPLRLVLPVRGGKRPAWLLRAGLFLYDHIGGRRLLPPTRTIWLANHPSGDALREGGRAFEYSDGWADDSRLVVLDARGAAQRGATVLPRHKLTRAVRKGDYWLLTAGGRSFEARALVNAAGPGIAEAAARNRAEPAEGRTRQAATWAGEGVVPLAGQPHARPSPAEAEGEGGCLRQISHAWLTPTRRRAGKGMPYRTAGSFAGCEG